MQTFIGRYDDYAIQLPDGRYRRVGKPLERSDVVDHLMGIRTYGTYVFNGQGMCSFAVFDADTQSGRDRLWIIQQVLASQGTTSYMEASRRGAHLWIFFASPVPASRVRRWLLPYWSRELELYPKQDKSNGYGSLIRLPLGVHRRSGKRYPFVEHRVSGVARVAPTLEETLVWLSTLQRVAVPEQAPIEEKPPATTHTPFSSPALTSHRQQSITTIRAWCASHDPVTFLGRYLDLNSAGVGHCPFHWHHSNQDTHASLKVYRPGVPGGYCWYCYAWQQGGSLFDFLRYYYRLDATTLWRRIQTEGLN